MGILHAPARLAVGFGLAGARPVESGYTPRAAWAREGGGSPAPVRESVGSRPPGRDSAFGADLIPTMSGHCTILVREVRRHKVDIPPANIRLMSLLDELGPSTISALAVADRCSQPTMSGLVNASVGSDPLRGPEVGLARPAPTRLSRRQA